MNPGCDPPPPGGTSAPLVIGHRQGDMGIRRKCVHRLMVSLYGDVLRFFLSIKINIQ